MSNELIASWLSGSHPHAWFDIDGTIKHEDKRYAHQFNPAVVKVLLDLKDVAGTGACTDQSPPELSSFLAKMTPENDGVFTGPSVLEGGHVLVERSKRIDKDFQILTSEDAQREMQTIIDLFLSGWMAIADDPEGWGLLPGVTTPVALAQGKYQGVGSVSIWEKGPNTQSPEYRGEYEAVFEWVKIQAEALQLFRHTAMREVGNGTLRIVQLGVSKASLLEQLHHHGEVDLSNSLYCGDGLNDIEPAMLVKQYGGIVLAVANACPELQVIADVVSDGVASDGVVEMFKEQV